MKIIILSLLLSGMSTVPVVAGFGAGPPASKALSEADTIVSVVFDKEVKDWVGTATVIEVLKGDASRKGTKIPIHCPPDAGYGFHFPDFITEAASSPDQEFVVLGNWRAEEKRLVLKNNLFSLWPTYAPPSIGGNGLSVKECKENIKNLLKGEELTHAGISKRGGSVPVPAPHTPVDASKDRAGRADAEVIFTGKVDRYLLFKEIDKDHAIWKVIVQSPRIGKGLKLDVGSKTLEAYYHVDFSRDRAVKSVDIKTGGIYKFHAFFRSGIIADGYALYLPDGDAVVAE